MPQHQRISRGRLLLVPLAIAGIAIIGAAIVLGLYVFVTPSVQADWPIPLGDRVAYSVHASLGAFLNRIGASPTAAGIQWVKAAAHAGTAADLDRATGGLASAIQRAPTHERLEDVLCPNALGTARFGALVATQRAGLQCSVAGSMWSHVPVGIRILYPTRPPTFGPHYATPYPRYGLVEESVAPGSWVHNLEHGAVVLLYRCDEPCQVLKTRLRELYERMELGADPPGHVRLLITPYQDMDPPIAVVAWRTALLLDELDADQVVRFYDTYVNLGPECQMFMCPDSDLSTPAIGPSR